MPKFYKLYMDFFKRNEIVWVMSQEDGMKYITLYQMLCIEALKNNSAMLTQKVGEETIPYTTDDIAKLTGYDKAVIKEGLYTLGKVNLVQNVSGAIYSPEIAAQLANRE